jgi:2-methylcitrate dehydratase PrpD
MGRRGRHLETIGKEVEAAETLAQFAAGLKYEDAPIEVRQHTKRNILDTMGIIIAASTVAEGCKELVGLIRDGGGKEESTILGFGGKVPAWMAAFANGAMARALCYDDAHDDAATHPSSITVPVALAVAERVGTVGGKELITAVTLGNELICRMGLSVCLTPQGWGADWFLATVHGVFGGAAACGKLLGFDAGKMQNAFGIALFDSAGTMEAVNPGSIATIGGMATGFTAKASVLSALMAERGIAGAKNSLEGKAGLYNVYFRGNYDRDVLLGELGNKFDCAGISIKPWPAVRNYHGYIEATLGLVREHDIPCQDIRQITVFIARAGERLQCQPAGPNAAVRCLPYLIAVAAAKRRVTIRDIAPEALREPATLELAQRVIPQFDERFSITSRMGSGKVQIELRNGKSHSKELDIAYGHPQNPIAWQDLIGKFRECASYSAKPISKQNVEEVIDMVNHLEEIDSVSRVLQILVS